MTSVTSSRRPAGTLDTVRNAAVILKLLADGSGPLRLTELAHRSGLSAANVHRLLRSLVWAGFVQQEIGSARYLLGPEVLRLSGRYLASLPVLAVLEPYLPELRDASSANALVAVLCGDTVAYVQEAVMHSQLGEIHRMAKASETAAGRVLTAWTSRASAEVASDSALRSGDDPAEGPPPFVILRREASDAPGSVPFTEVAVPVLTRSGTPAAALALMWRSDVFNEQHVKAKVLPHMVHVARRATSRLALGA